MKKTNPYKVGDRVYWYNKKGTRVDEEVVDIGGAYCLFSNGIDIHFRAIQGRLKPKKPLREIWVNYYRTDSAGVPDGFVYVTRELADKCAGGKNTECVHFVEKRKK